MNAPLFHTTIEVQMKVRIFRKVTNFGSKLRKYLVKLRKKLEKTQYDSDLFGYLSFIQKDFKTKMK